MLKTVCMSPLDQLLEIPAFGKQVFQGAHFKIKYRRKISAAVDTKLSILKTRYPELLIHRSEVKKSVIFGGTFPQHSNFISEMKFLFSIGRR